MINFYLGKQKLHFFAWNSKKIIQCCDRPIICSKWAIILNRNYTSPVTTICKQQMISVYCNVQCSYVTFLLMETTPLWSVFIKFQQKTVKTVMFPEDSIFYSIFVLIPSQYPRQFAGDSITQNEACYLGYQIRLDCSSFNSKISLNSLIKVMDIKYQIKISEPWDIQWHSVI